MPEGNVVVSLRVGGEVVYVTVHAIDRYIERVKPGSTRVQAAEDLERLAGVCRFGQRPEWARSRPRGDKYDCRWMMIGDDVGFPIQDDFAVTCITRGSLSDLALERRSKKRAKRAEVRKAMRQGGRFSNESPSRYGAGSRKKGRGPSDLAG